jgi:hypothetical protein
MPPAKPWDGKADAAHDYQLSRHDRGQAPRDLTPPSRTDLAVTASWDLLGIDETSFTRSPKLTVLLGLDWDRQPALRELFERPDFDDAVGDGARAARGRLPVVPLSRSCR